MSFPFYHQHDSSDCGPASLRMIAAFYGRKIRIGYLRELCHITRDGVSLLGISNAAGAIGLKSLGVSLSYKDFISEAPLPCIVHWNQKHFVVVYRIRKSGKKQRIMVADPAHGKLVYQEDEFKSAWLTEEEGTLKGICLLLEPTPAFYSQTDENINRNRYQYLLPFLKPHKAKLLLLMATIFIGTGLQFAFPFLTQQIVDRGIRLKDLNFITLVLAGQMLLFFGLLASEFIRGRIQLIVSTQVNIKMISAFLVKLLRLPIGFFDSRITGDLMQRISDQQRIQSFLTISSLNIVLSMLTLFVFGAILLYYSGLVFLVFLTGSVLYAIWIYLFLKRRKDVDYLRFSRLAESQENILQMIQGMQEIKLNNSELKKRKEWERIQDDLLNIDRKGLRINQYQNVGAYFFGRTKDILITFITALLVIRGEISIGMMLAVQFILGQLNAPVEQMVIFTREAQDASISMERLEEINLQKEEEPDNGSFESPPKVISDISLREVAFQYEGPFSPFVLENVTLTIPAEKVTAIVGSSGSGKTTLIKVLLGFYKPVRGTVTIGEMPLDKISPSGWRSRCGTVLQDGFIFSDTLAGNIALSDHETDVEKLKNSIRIAKDINCTGGLQ